MLTALLRGAAAGAAGTTALDATTYLDMVLRGRGASSTPEQSIEKSAERAGVVIPGEGEARDNRVSGLGALSGIATGVSVGAVLGGLRAAGLRPGPVLGPLLATGVALVAANVPMAALGVSDPRRWTATDWVSDLVPHLAYGLVTHATLAATDRVRGR
jgi:hypothetical protein